MLQRLSLQTAMKSPLRMYTCHAAVSTVMIHVGHLFPLSLDFSDESFALPAACGTIATVTAIATGSFWLSAGPVGWVWAGLAVTTAATGGMVLTLPKWWRDRGCKHLLIELCRNKALTDST